MRKLGEPEATMYALEAGAAVLVAKSAHHVAVQLLSAAERIREKSGYWLQRPDYDWGDTPTVTVEAWCEGAEPVRARFALAGLHGPYIFPSVFPL